MEKLNIGDVVYQNKDMSVNKIYRCNKIKQWFIRKFINKKFNVPYAIICDKNDSGFSLNVYYEDTILYDQDNKK